MHRVRVHEMVKNRDIWAVFIKLFKNTNDQRDEHHIMLCVENCWAYNEIYKVTGSGQL